MRDAAKTVAAAFPRGQGRALRGQTHAVDPAVLPAVLGDFFKWNERLHDPNGRHIMEAASRDVSKATGAFLLCGIFTGPLFFAVAIIHALTRPGFDIRHNAISQLSLGDLGWIQITSFILTGLLAVACAIGVRRALKRQRGGAWGALLIVPPLP
jgi:hypothetical protein